MYAIRSYYGKASSSFCSRSEDFSGPAGKFEVNKFFHGPSALFGGIEYQTPWSPLRLKLEYDGNDYSNEFAGTIQQDSPFNIGAVYRLSDPVEMHLSYERGNTFMWGITFRTNFNDWKPIQYAKPASVVVKTQGETPSHWNDVSDQLDKNAGYQHVQIVQNEQTLIMRGEQQKYRDHQESVDRAVAILANNSDHSVKKVQIQDTEQNLPISNTEVDLDKFRVAKTGVILGEDAPVYTHASESTDIGGERLYQQGKVV